MSCRLSWQAVGVGDAGRMSQALRERRRADVTVSPLRCGCFRHAQFAIRSVSPVGEECGYDRKAIGL